jgi:hypothetical protein
MGGALGGTGGMGGVGGLRDRPGCARLSDELVAHRNGQGYVLSTEHDMRSGDLGHAEADEGVAGGNDARVIRL